MSRDNLPSPSPSYPLPLSLLSPPPPLQVYTFVTPPSEPLDVEHTDSGPVLVGSGEQVPLVTGADRHFTMNSLESSNILIPFRETLLHWTIIINMLAYVSVCVCMCVCVCVCACVRACVCVCVS